MKYESIKRGNASFFTFFERLSHGLADKADTLPNRRLLLKKRCLGKQHG